MGEKWVVPLVPLEGVWAALDKVQLGGTLSCAVVRWPGALVANLFKNSLSFITLSLPPFCLSGCNQTILSSHFSPYHSVLCSLFSVSTQQVFFLRFFQQWISVGKTLHITDPFGTLNWLRGLQCPELKLLLRDTNAKRGCLCFESHGIKSPKQKRNLIR